MYRDFLRAGHTGVQHVAYWTEQFDADLARARKRGASRSAMSGEVGANGRFVYFESRRRTGPIRARSIELSEVAGPKGRLFKLIREAAARLGRPRSRCAPFPDCARCELAH